MAGNGMDGMFGCDPAKDSTSGMDASGTGIVIAICGAGASRKSDLMLALGTGLFGRVIELVVSEDGPGDRTSSMPELEAQLASAAQASRIADTVVKRMRTRTQEQESETGAGTKLPPRQLLTGNYQKRLNLIFTMSVAAAQSAARLSGRAKDTPASGICASARKPISIFVPMR
jgi:hypothetical protein